MADHKATEQEKRNRITETVRMYCRSYSDIDILQYATGAWNIEERQARRYMQWAREWLSREADLDRNFELSRALGTLRGIQNEALISGKYAEAISAQREIDRIQGLRAPKKHMIIGTEDVDLLTLEEIEQWLSGRISDEAALELMQRRRTNGQS